MTSRTDPPIDATIEAWAECNGVSLRYRISGAGPRSLMLFNGLGNTLEAWEPVARRLEPDFRVLRFDQRGSGQSEKVRAAFTLADLVADAKALIASIGLAPPYGLASQAAGAAVALAFAAAHVSETSAVGMCAPATGATPERARLLIERSERAIREGMRAVIGDSLERSWPEAMRADRAAFEDYRARLLAADPVGYALANRVLATADLEDVIAALDIPCLVLAGRQDVMRPPESLELLVRRMKRAELQVIEAPHLMIMHCPDTVADALGAFFRQHMEPR